MMMSSAGASRAVVLLWVAMVVALPGPARSTGDARDLTLAARLGGLGTGWVGVRDDGSFGQAALAANGGHPTPAQPGAFAAIWTDAGGRRDARVLAASSPYGLPVFRSVEARSHYPFVDVAYLDDDLPVSVSMRAYAPLQPHDVAASTIPAIVVVYTVRNLARAPVRVAVLAGWQPTLGLGGSPREPGRRTGVRPVTSPAADGVVGMRFDGPPLSDAVVSDIRLHNARGSQAVLASFPAADAEASACSWNALDRRPAWWDSFAREGVVSGAVDAAEEGRLHPAGCVAMRTELRPAEEREFAFAVAWHALRFWDEIGDAWSPPWADRFRDADAAGRFALADRRLIETLSHEWQSALGKSKLGAAQLHGMCAELEELAASSVVRAPDAEGARRRMRFRLGGGTGAGSGGLMDLRTRAHLHPCLLAMFPALDAEDLEARISPPAGATATTPSTQTDQADLIIATAEHFRATANAPWLSSVWPSLRRIGDGLAEPDSAAQPGSVTQALASLVDLASSANDGDAAARYQARLRPAASRAASSSSADSAWLAWALALGCRMDARTETLTIAPRMVGANRQLSGPVFDPRFWATLDIRPSPARTVVEFRLDRLTQCRLTPASDSGLPGAASPFERIRVLEFRERGLEDITRAQALLGADPLQVSLERPGDGVLRVVLAAPALVRPGDRLRVVLMSGPHRSPP